MKTKIYSIIGIIITALVLAGCSTPESRIKHNPELFASIPPAEQALIKQGRIAVGFTPDMVKLALGEPDIIARKIDRTGTAEIWRYRGYDYNDGYYGGYWGAGPYWGWGGRYGYWGAYYGGWGPYGGWAPAPMSDYLRVTIRDGRVSEISQLR